MLNLKKNTIPNGCKNSPPCPSPKAKGNIPTTIVIVVMRIRRNLCGAAFKIAQAAIAIYGSKNYLVANGKIDNITEHTWIAVYFSLKSAFP